VGGFFSSIFLPVFFLLEKVMNKNGVERSDMQRLRREISIMESLNHPGIVRLYRVIETDMVVALVLEFMPG
jgi:serine/threonine protein kinase